MAGKINNEDTSEKENNNSNRKDDDDEVRYLKGRLKKAEAFILDVLENNKRNVSMGVFVPKGINEQVKQLLGHEVTEHRINANEIHHAWNNHGVGNEKDPNQIPLRKEDFGLIPYIMVAPDKVQKGNKSVFKGELVNSIRYIKNLSNGAIVCVEREVSTNKAHMSNITMWAKSDVNVATDNTMHNTSETKVIEHSDVAKIRKDAETAIENDKNIRYSKVNYKYEDKIRNVKTIDDIGFGDVIHNPTPSKYQVDKLNKWLNNNPNTVLRLYHGTSSKLAIKDNGLKVTTSIRRNSYQSTSGYVYLSPFKSTAQMFGEMANPYGSKVYSVDVPIRLLKPDIDQLNNKRLAGYEIGNSLAESIVYGRSVRIKGNIPPYMINDTNDDEPRYSRKMSPETKKELAEIKAKAIANGTFMKAPNGKPTNLNERQWLHVRLKSFKKWFGDWERLAQLINSKTNNDALEWTKLNEDWIIKHFVESSNKLDPDEVRSIFSLIGYDGTNVPDYREAEKYIVNKIYEAKLEKAERDGNKTIAFITGVGGSGKSNATKSLDLSKKSITFDSAFNHYNSLEKQLKKAHEKGFEIEVIAVHNDPITAFTNTLERGKRSGRFLSLQYFIKSYISNQDKIALLAKNYPNVKITAYDNSGNNTKGISVEEAKEWVYELKSEQTEQLLNILENESRRLTENQLASVARDLRQIKESVREWTSEMGRLSTRIETRLLRLQEQRTGREVGTDKGERVRLEQSVSKVVDENGEPLVVYHGIKLQ